MIGAIILGLVAGFIGKLLMPGKDPGVITSGACGSYAVWSLIGQLEVRLIDVFLKTLLPESCRIVPPPLVV